MGKHLAMARSVEITVPAEQTDELIAFVRQVDGVTTVKVFRGASVKPDGDVVSFEGTNDATLSIVHEVLDERFTGASVSTSEPKSLISSDGADRLDRESNDSLWEESALFLRKESNVSVNYLALMALVGGVAAVGLWTDTIHIVIGAMVLAPGFHPLLRIAFGYVAGPRSVGTQGYRSSLIGYAVLALAAAATMYVLHALTPNAPNALDGRHWVRYWSTVTASGVLLSALAAAGGAFTVVANRAVLAAGAMIALSLVPAMAVTGMALASGDFDLAGSAAWRWAIDVLLVLALGAAVLFMKKSTVQRRVGRP